MAREHRFEYAGAYYHITARGDGGKMIFESKEDAESFLYWLSELHETHGCVIHAWVLMGNHFHLLLETPTANLVSSMRYLISHYSQGWNARRERRGHVFQGGYKAVPVSSEHGVEGSYIRIAADYIHFNPIRAGLLGCEISALVDYPWSSLKHYRTGKAPKWMNIQRVLDDLSLDLKKKVRRAYVYHLEASAQQSKGQVSTDAMRALREGWYLGEDRFRNHLMNLMDESTAQTTKIGNVSGSAVNERNESEAEKIVHFMSAELGLEDDGRAWRSMFRRDERKVIMATLIRSKTKMSNTWVAKRLEMGDGTNVSRLVNAMKGGKKMMAKIKSYDKKYTNSKD